MVLMKRGTVVLAFLFLGVVIIGFTLEVSVLVALAGENSSSPVGCYKLTPSTGWQRVDCIDPYRPFVILPPLLAASLENIPIDGKVARLTCASGRAFLHAHTNIR